MDITISTEMNSMNSLKEHYDKYHSVRAEIYTLSWAQFRVYCDLHGMSIQWMPPIRIKPTIIKDGHFSPNGVFSLNRGDQFEVTVSHVAYQVTCLCTYIFSSKLVFF